jgi:hypothetical protein
MNAFFPPKLLRTCMIVGVLSCGLGWSLRHFATSGAVGSFTEESRISVPASRNASFVESQERVIDESPAGVRRRIVTSIHDLSISNPDDMVAMIGSIGVVTGLTDAEVRIAWAELAKQTPTKTFGGSLTATYLWSRMVRMGEEVWPPQGWGVEEKKVAVQSEIARHDMAKILGKMVAGAQVSEIERRVALTEAVRADPLEAVKLMCRSTRPGDYQSSAPFLSAAMTRPESREAIMAELRKWHEGGGSLPDTIAFVARSWINQDPQAVERWLGEPAQADIREATMNEVINARTMTNPGDAWAWCQSAGLSDERRRETLGYSSQHLANENPREGMSLIAGLEDPEDRREVIGKFGPILAGSDFDQWQQWRETLTPVEQKVAGDAAFHVWARKDLDGAVDFLSAQPSGEAKDQMISTLISVHAASRPEKAVEWIRQISNSDRRHQAVSAALSYIGFDDLERSRKILNALSAG